MLDSFQGLPVHALIVHATVVMVPTAALVVALASVYPRFRSWIGIGMPVAAVVALILVPLSTESGDKLKDHIDPGPPARVAELIHEHEELADTLLWYVLPLVVVAVVGYLLHRRGNVSTTLTAVVAVVSIALGAATIVDVARIGHAGAKAAWDGTTNLDHGNAPSSK
ncbi:MAG: DUF2231 domain-containing protein [Marmoricola sp.]